MVISLLFLHCASVKGGELESALIEKGSLELPPFGALYGS